MEILEFVGALLLGTLLFVLCAIGVVAAIVAGVGVGLGAFVSLAAAAWGKVE